MVSSCRETVCSRKGIFILTAVLVLSSLGLMWWYLQTEIQLITMSIIEADNVWQDNGRSSDIIVSLSTLPHRLAAIDLTLKSLMTQSMKPRKIQLQLPLFSRRDNATYEIPLFLQGLASVEIKHVERDWGPATKFIPPVLSEEDDQAIVIVDDDYIYPPTWIELFHKFASSFPNAAIATRGWDVPRNLKWKDSKTIFGSSLSEPMKVDVVTGCGGILIRPRFFDKNAVTAYEGAPKEAFFVDDIWISGHLAKHNVDRFLFPTNNDRHRTQFSRILVSDRGLINTENKGGHNNDVMLAYFASEWHYDDGREAGES